MVATDAFLPLEMIMSVFLLLPPETLCKMMSVCKSWRDLIKSEDFAALYLKNSESKGGVFLLYPSLREPGDMSFNLLDEETRQDVSRLPIPPVPRWRDNISIVGSFNGVLCLTETFLFGFTIYLCNPAIRKYRVVNLSTIDMRPVTTSALGFAYHSLVDDCKVIRIAYGSFRAPNLTSFRSALSPDGKSYDVRAEVYSMRSDSWTAIEVSYFPWYLTQSSEVLLNESLHWVGAPLGAANVGQKAIVAFDMGEQVFTEIIFPNALRSDSLFLGVYKDLLATFTYCPYQVHPDYSAKLWVMEDYGDGNSWKKLYGFNMDFGIERPLKITENEQIVLIDYEHSVLIHNFDDAVAYELYDTLPPPSEFVTYRKSLALIGERNGPIYGIQSALPGLQPII